MPKHKDENSKPVHPKDRFFRGYMGRPRNTRQLLRWKLPKRLQKKLNWRTMRVRLSTFVDERLRRRESDLLVEFKTKDGDPVLVYVLWEHQSVVEMMMAWRIWEYRTEIMKAWRAENPNAKELPYIHAMVLYQGKAKWTAPLNVSGLIPLQSIGGTQELSSEYEVVPVNDLPKLGWPNDLALRIGLSLMRAVTHKKQLNWLIESDLEGLLKQPEGSACFRLVVEYILLTEDEEKVIEVLEQTTPTIEKNIMTFAEAAETRGIEKGIERTQRQMVEAMLKNGLTPEKIAEVTETPLDLVKKIAAASSKKKKK